MTETPFGVRKRLDRDECDRIGTAAIKEAFPYLTHQEARQQLAEAVAWASINHQAWLHRGVPYREWERQAFRSSRE
jgi:hypothetical protein